jgi:hypothetical protein
MRNVVLSTMSGILLAWNVSSVFSQSAPKFGNVKAPQFGSEQASKFADAETKSTVM